MEEAEVEAMGVVSMEAEGEVPCELFGAVETVVMVGEGVMAAGQAMAEEAVVPAHPM